MTRSAARGRGLTRREFAGLAGGLAAAALVGGRIAYVNATASFDIPVVHHEPGAWVDLGGAFLTNASEMTDGYRVRVVSAEILSRNEYVERYANDGSEPLEGCDVPCMACLGIEVENTDSQGALDLLSMVLVPARKNEQLVYDGALFLAGEEALRSSGWFSGYLAVRPGTTYLTHVPFMRRSAQVQVGGSSVPQGYVTSLTDISFELRLSNAPVRHVVDVAV